MVQKSKIVYKLFGNTENISYIYKVNNLKQHKKSVMENQFKKSITAHIERLHTYYKEESDKWEIEMKKNPKLKQPRELYLQYHWEYRSYQMLLTNINAGNYDSVDYYNQYLKPKTK
jgi:hypothetical protein